MATFFSFPLIIHLKFHFGLDQFCEGWEIEIKKKNYYCGNRELNNQRVI